MSYFVEDLVALMFMRPANVVVSYPESKIIALSLIHILDFQDISGQEVLKRAAEIAVAGQHNLLMIGTPGASKTMVAKRIPTILPPLTLEESIEISKVYSILGMLDESHPLMLNRPFRQVHHTATRTALAGGGLHPSPGEISLAHGGVLFLDELTEYRKEILEMLRQPLESRCVEISLSLIHISIEEAYAKTETPVVSNNSAHRWTPDVPMVVPEINSAHFDVIPDQRKRLGTTRGFIAVKPNCSIQSYAPCLAAWK